ncbi:hypothetical protein D3C77_677310 [compost metagenome]
MWYNFIIRTRYVSIDYCALRRGYDMPDDVAQGCDYQGRHFGALYPDTQCVDGFLWDEDSYDEPGGALRHGGDIPCPKCNSASNATYYGSE